MLHEGEQRKRAECMCWRTGVPTLQRTHRIQFIRIKLAAINQFSSASPLRANLPIWHWAVTFSIRLSILQACQMSGDVNME